MVPPKNMPASLLDMPSWAATMGYNTIAMVDMAVTPITVSSVSRSWFSPLGNIVEIASAADAPHIATEPPVRAPNLFCNPKDLANTTPSMMVVKIAIANISAVCHPKTAKSPKAIRSPSNTTPARKSVLAVKSMPQAQGVLF